MSSIYESQNFICDAPKKPLVSREEGGHIRIKVKDISITDRTKLSPEMATELMRLTVLIGESLTIGMTNRGIDIIKVNYEDLGNWAYKKGQKPYLHIHVFGRTPSATKQSFPDAVQLPDRSTGFYESFEPLSEEDIREIKKVIDQLLLQDKFNPDNWRLTREAS